MVRLWLKDGKAPILPPSAVLEEYLATYEDKPLADGKPDPRVKNGQGEQLLELIRSMEARGWEVGESAPIE